MLEIGVGSSKSKSAHPDMPVFLLIKNSLYSLEHT